MHGRRTRKLASVVTAALAAGLLAVPVAQARLSVDAQHTALVNKAVGGQIVDARHAALLNKAHVGNAAPQNRIFEMHQRLGQLELPAVQGQVSDDSTGFDWGDAGIGASAGLGLVLLAAGGVLVTRRRLVGA